MLKTLVDITIKEHNGSHLITIDRLKQIPVNQAIEILTIKYSTSGLFKKICKGFNIMAEDFEKILYKKK